MKNLVPLGHVAIFYIPIHKLNAIYGLQTAREMFEQYLIENYDAFTLEISNTLGFWRAHKDAEIAKDSNVRYEVSFSGKERIPDFVNFLSEMCALMNEQAIYLTMGWKSYLVLPQEKNEV